MTRARQVSLRSTEDLDGSLLMQFIHILFIVVWRMLRRVLCRQNGYASRLRAEAA